MLHLNDLGPFSFFLLTEVALRDDPLSPGKDNAAASWAHDFVLSCPKESSSASFPIH
jgi:hypothetical protein